MKKIVLSLVLILGFNFLALKKINAENEPIKAGASCVNENHPEWSYLPFTYICEFIDSNSFYYGATIIRLKANVNNSVCSSTIELLKENDSELETITGQIYYQNLNGWTTWWRGISTYCVNSGEWAYSSAIIPGAVNVGSPGITIIPSSQKDEYTGKLLENTQNRVTIQGERKIIGEPFVTPPILSPFIYLENQPQEKVNIKINSEFNIYKNQKPAFNSKNGWEVESDGKNITVNNKKTENLFYELGLKKINLSRNGKNFNSQEELINFLKTSEFFEKLEFNKVEKENALNYVLPRLPEAKNYYLTILENPKTVTQLEVMPKAKIIQKYFVIYPTTIPVKTFGELVYPEKVSDTEEFVVKNYGEIIVKPEMFVIWE